MAIPADWRERFKAELVRQRDTTDTRPCDRCGVLIIDAPVHMREDGYYPVWAWRVCHTCFLIIKEP